MTPRPVCAGCGVLLPGFGQPMCWECTRMGGFEQFEGCNLCSVGLELKGGLHYNKTGAYAGKCKESSSA
jgi:hypothetical protein